MSCQLIIKNKIDNHSLRDFWCIIWEFKGFRDVAVLKLESVYENKVSQCLVSVKIKN